jgi:alpha,alpha-trehalase
MTGDWSLVYEDYDPAQQGLREALCTLGNGHFATRGAAPEASADDAHYPGTYLAGGYNRRVTHIAGRDVENEDLVNLPNWLPLTFRVDDGPWHRLDDVELLAYHQALELREGLLTRELRFRDAAGRITRWYERRLVSMSDCHVAALSVEITPEDWSGRLTVQSALNGNVTNDGVERYRELEGQHVEVLATDNIADDAVLLHARTNQSRIEVAQAMRTHLYRDGTIPEFDRTPVAEGGWIGHELSLDVGHGETIRIDKAITLYSSREPAISEARLAACEKIAEIADFDALLADHRRAWDDLWGEFDVSVETDVPDTLLKVRLHEFHVLQTTSLHTIKYDVGAPARGWHGEAYRGHIFWDELFVFPFLSLRVPEVARALLLYRYRRLPAARRAARQAGLAGAMFPWQSGSDGREESQRVHLNPESGRWIPDHSHRQRHINAAIAYNVWHYCQVTDDHEFLYFYGTEMFVEIARFWASIATYDKATGRYSIRGVMGPDEYHTSYPDVDPDEHPGLDDNAYTNVMAAWCLIRALDALALLPGNSRRALSEALGLEQHEEEQWERISRRLHVPFHDGGIISQFAGYEALEEFDWERYRRKYDDIRRLDRILEAEGDSPNRYKVSKQADVLMLFYLFSADELHMLFEHLGYTLDHTTIPRTVLYYLDRTAHGSTLSAVAHAWVLSRTDRSRSWDCFQEALDSDIRDAQGGTTPEGIHFGAMGGTLDLLHRCYLGLETRGNTLHLDPLLPEQLRYLEVRLRYRRHQLYIRVDHEHVTITSLPLVAPPIMIAYRGRTRAMSPGLTFTFPLVDRERETMVDARRR